MGTEFHLRFTTKFLIFQTSFLIPFRRKSEKLQNRMFSATNKYLNKISQAGSKNETKKWLKRIHWLPKQIFGDVDKSNT